MRQFFHQDFQNYLPLVISGIGKNTEKLNEERGGSRKIIQMFRGVSGYGDSGEIDDNFSWAIPAEIRYGAVTYRRQIGPFFRTLCTSSLAQNSLR